MQNLQSFAGIFILIGIAWVFSEDRSRFPWRVVGWGLLLQLIFGFLVLRWEPGAQAFLTLNEVFNALLDFSKEGSYFVFNALALGPGEERPGATSLGFFFAFQVLTTIIFFSSLLSVLYYLGIMQKIVVLFAKIMSYTMGVSGAESLSNSANIFVGQTEAPLVVRPYIERMTRSEIMAIMVGGFANTAGGVLGAYVMMLHGHFPNIAAHLISASLLSAPAAFIFAKVLVPEREEPLTKGEVRLEVEIQDANVLDAAANGASVGWSLAVNVGAMLIAFVALIAMVNLGVSWLGGFLRDGEGLLLFNLMLGGALLSLAWVELRGVPRDAYVWGLLLALWLVVLAFRAAGLPSTGGRIGLVGAFAWLPLFLQLYRPRGAGARGWGSVLAVLVAGDAAYLALGGLPEGTDLSLQLILGWLHWPIAWIMGVPTQDCLAVGKLLGEKLILTEFIAYLDLAGMLAAGQGPSLDPRSVVIVSYALCGFSNLASIAIQIGGIAPLAPSRRADIARLGLKAMIGGALATFMIACVAGTFYTGSSMLGAAPAAAEAPAPAEPAGEPTAP